MLQRIRNTRFVLLALLAATTLLFAVPVSGIASAHDQLISSSPVEGEEFEQAPTEATLRFSAEMIEIGAEIALQNVDTAETVELPDAFEIDYDTLTQPLPELPAGAYAINWRVVSQDGHPISGTINFTVTVGAATDDAAEEPVAGGNAEPTTEATAGFGNAPAQTGDDSALSAGNDDSESGVFSEPWMIVVISIVGVLVLAGALVMFVMRMRRGNQPGQ